MKRRRTVDQDCLALVLYQSIEEKERRVNYYTVTKYNALFAIIFIDNLVYSTIKLIDSSRLIQVYVKLYFIKRF